MKIIFMGTPEFAVPSLDILYQSGYNIVGVITSVDKYGGRGRKTLLESSVKKYAQSKGLKILQPKNLKSPSFQNELKALAADLQIVVAFRMLPEGVWNMPKYGTYNLHGSLLPRYRGAAPINWAIINGDETTGVTSFKLKHKIDTGSILIQREIPIYKDDTAGDLHDRMKWIGADVILETVRRIESGQEVLKEQNEAEVSHAPKLNKENTEINLSHPGKKIIDHIRGLSPYPTAWLNLDGKSTQILQAAFVPEAQNMKEGTILTDGKKYLRIACSDGYLDIQELKMSGKKKLPVKVFLNGYTFENSTEEM
jgi:methionyl-tRNA formyltransferase